MRILLVTAVALSLTGCADTNFYGDSSEPARQQATAAPPPAEAAEATNVAAQPLPPAEPAAQPMASAAPAATSMPLAASAAPGVQPTPPPSIAQTTPPSVHCTELAKLRARDAAYSGEDEQVQDQVYRKTYADCLDWETRHRS